MTKTITITKSIPAPPDGWEYQDREPKDGEEYAWISLGGKFNKDWFGPCKVDTLAGKTPFDNDVVFCFRVRDECAERYEAIKLPDGFVMLDGMNRVTWREFDDKFPAPQCFNGSLRAIRNGKAIKP